jgi:hypothetical protein
MTASWGSSSSSSSHSASLSFTVFRFESCHDALLEFSPGDGNASMFRELFRESVRCPGIGLCVCDGDGDREERWGAARLRLLSDGTEGDVKPLLACVPGAES